MQICSGHDNIILVSFYLKTKLNSFIMFMSFVGDWKNSNNVLPLLLDCGAVVDHNSRVNQNPGTTCF